MLRGNADCDNIQTSTFENYLKEMDSKYSPGTIVRSDKYPDIDDQPLQGSKILEGPASNQTSSKLAEFYQLPQQYNVTIRFQNRIGMLSGELKSKYNSIQLLERYKFLSESFQRENPFEKYDTTVVLKMLHGLGYDFSYNEKESFFGYKTLDNGFDFRINLSLKYGIVETIIWAKNLNTNEQHGGPVSRIVKQIQTTTDKNNQMKIPYPRFSTYEDLEKIVTELMSIFYDFKSVVQDVV